MAAMARKTRRGRRAEAGTAAIEFGLSVPLLLLLLMGAVEFGFYIYEGMQVYNSVEAGMVEAAKNGFSDARISAAVVNATDTKGITATPAPAEFCGCPNATGIVSAACDATCSDGTKPGQYVRISASLSHQTILPYPGLSLQTPLTAHTVLRLN